MRNGRLDAGSPFFWQRVLLATYNKSRVFHSSFPDPPVDTNSLIADHKWFICHPTDF